MRVLLSIVTFIKQTSQNKIYLNVCLDLSVLTLADLFLCTFLKTRVNRYRFNRFTLFNTDDVLFFRILGKSCFADDVLVVICCLFCTMGEWKFYFLNMFFFLFLVDDFNAFQNISWINTRSSLLLSLHFYVKLRKIWSKLFAKQLIYERYLLCAYL